MKKIVLFFAILTVLILNGCKKNQTDSISQTSVVQPSDTNQTIVQEIPVTAPNKTDEAQSPSSLTPDVDMTKMSATMIYAEVFNMLVMPEEYTDKIIKVAGNFKVFESETDGERFYAILIPDATKCCTQGIEFVWQGEHSYPSDYPAIDEEITITGTYNCIEYENGLTYTYLDVWQLDRNS